LLCCHGGAVIRCYTVRQGCYVAVNALAVQYSYIPIIICSVVIGIEVILDAGIFLDKYKGAKALHKWTVDGNNAV